MEIIFTADMRTLISKRMREIFAPTHETILLEWIVKDGVSLNGPQETLLSGPVRKIIEKPNSHTNATIE